MYASARTTRPAQAPNALRRKPRLSASLFFGATWHEQRSYRRRGEAGHWDRQGNRGQSTRRRQTRIGWTGGKNRRQDPKRRRRSQGCPEEVVGRALRTRSEWHLQQINQSRGEDWRAREYGEYRCSTR